MCLHVFEPQSSYFQLFCWIVKFFLLTKSSFNHIVAVKLWQLSIGHSASWAHPHSLFVEIKLCSQCNSLAWTRVSKKLSVWVCFRSSSKQDALFKSCIALGTNIALMILYCIASWQKCHGASHAISISLWMPNQKIAPAMASQLNQQSVEPRPESFLQFCHHINQLGNEVQLEGWSQASCCLLLLVLALKLQAWWGN